jgi:hypothetical protein
MIGCCCNTTIHLLSVTFSCCKSISIFWSSACSWFAGWTFHWYSKCWRHHHSQVNHRCACWWKHCSLPLSLVSWCCCCPHNSPLKLDGSLFISSLTRKHSRWKSGKLRAHIFFRSARILRFGHGVQRPSGHLLIFIHQRWMNSVTEAKTSLSCHNYFPSFTLLIIQRMSMSV